MKKSTSKIIESTVKANTIWSSGNSFLQFKVSKVMKKSGKIWVYYFLTNNPKQKYSCFEEAFLQRFYPQTNLY